MAYINVKSDSMRNVSSQLEDLSSRIGSLSDELESVARQSGLKAAGYASIKRRLTSALSSANTEADKIRLMAGAIEEIRAAYEKTENLLVNATENKKSSIQEASDRIRDMLVETGELLGMDAAAMYSDDPVNLTNGNYVYEKNFFNFDTPLSINFRVFYNVCGHDVGVLGKGWLHNFERRIVHDGTTYRVHGEDGSVQIFRRDQQGIITSAWGSFGELKLIDSGFLYIDVEHDSYYFDPDGRLSAIANMNGWRIDLRYEQDRLHEVTCTDGISLRFTYDPSGRLTAVADHTDRCIKFGYSEGFLTQVEDMAGNITIYEYDESGRLCRVISPTGDISVHNIYDSQNRTIQQFFADGGTVTYRYLNEQDAVIMNRQDGSEVTYYHDQQFRGVKAVYPDGEEQIKYNANNQRTAFIDKLGRINRYAYDNAGHLLKFTNANGNALEFSYNLLGQLTELSMDGQQLSSAIYDEKGHQIVHTDANGAECRFSYDELGRVLEVVHEDGSHTALEYDECGNVISVQDPVTGRTKYHYDECRRVISTVNALGNETRYKYDALDQLIQVVNAEGCSRDYSYDARGNITKVIDFNGGITSIQYNAMNRPVSVTDPDGRMTKYEYDKMSRPIRKIAADGGVTEYGYDSEGRMIQIRHPESGIETAKYDAVGNLVERKAADGGIFKFKYDVLDRPVSVTDPLQGERSAAYDKLGNVTAISYEDGTVEQFTYDLMGNMLSHTDQSGYTRYFCYNALRKVEKIWDKEGILAQYTYGLGGQLLREQNADGSFLEYSYDAIGNVVQVVDSIRGCWRFQYDSMNRVNAVDHVGEGIETYEYDHAGNIIAVIDGNGNKTAYQFSKAGALEKVTDACGTETVYRYDPCYRLTQILQSESGHFDAEQINTFNEKQKIRITNYEHDLEGSVTAVIDAEGGRTEYSYDPCGRMISRLDQEGNLTRCTYRLDGTEERLTFGDGRFIKYQYDALKRLSQIEDWLGVTRFNRDASGRVTEVIDHEGDRTGYTWNDRGLCTELQYPDGKGVFYEYDQAMRLSRLTADDVCAQYEYYNNGQLRMRQCPNDVRIGYEYDEVGRLSSLVRWHGDDVTDRFAYAYDACARKTRITEKHGDAAEIDFRYQYDMLGRLVGVMRDGSLVQSYEYDIFGNRSRMVRDRQETIYGYDSLDRMLWSRSGDQERTFCYDKRGNLTSESINGVLRLSLHFGALNRLEKAVSNLGEAEYSYNGMAALVGTVFSYNGISRREKMTFDYTGEQNHLLAAFRDGAWEDYVWDGQPVLSVSQRGTSYYLNDERMSSRGVLSLSGYDEYAYDPFGLISQDVMSPAQFAYTGYRLDPISGFYNAGWRQYDASSGRFISRDPVAGTLLVPMSLNPFIYCMGDPINNVDPTGMILAWLAGGIAGAAANFGVKLAGDIVSSVKNGKWTGSSWESYVGTVAGGFVQGSVYAVAGPAAAGAAGAATETFITSGLSMAFGEEGYRKEDGYNVGKLLWDTGVSATVGAVSEFTFGKAGESINKYIRIPGITKGTGSYESVWKQVMTKAQRGQIKNVSLKTLGKGLMSFGLFRTFDEIIVKGIDAIKESAEDKIEDVLSWLFNRNTSSSLPAGMREFMAPNRRAVCSTA